MVSDGLNALSLTDDGHLLPYLEALGSELARRGVEVAKETLVVRGGRVRAGYRIGETLFGTQGRIAEPRAIVHLIGERPGSGHHAFSAYITAAPPLTWSQQGVVDHDITRVVSGIADTALRPEDAAATTARILVGLTSS